MATFHIKLDSRRKDGLGRHPVVAFIRNRKTVATKDTGLFVNPEQWLGGEDGKYVSRTCPNSKKINEMLFAYDKKYRTAFIQLNLFQSTNTLPACEIADIIFDRAVVQQKGLLMQDIEEYMKTCTSGTAATFLFTLNKVKLYCNNTDIPYSSITYDWLKQFDKWMQDSGLKINTRGIVMRNIRVLYNDAIRKCYVAADKYPFRAFKIKTSVKEKDFLRPDDIVKLRDMKLSGRAAYTRDFFLLSLYLGGINPVDLFNLEKPDAKGRVQYQRQKIKDRTDSYISLKIQPEAMEIVDRYADDKYLVNFINNYSNFRTFYSHVRSEIKKLGEMLGYPNMTLYWARYTWATIADGIGVSERLISRILGHKDKSLAEKRYIVAFNWDRADVANREVLDHIFDK